MNSRNSCSYCEGKTKEKYWNLEDRLETTSEKYSIRECQKCKLAQLSPFPNGDYGRFYPKNYLLKNGSSKLDRWYRFDQYNFDFNWLKKLNISFKRYLDIGCGSGDRVEFAAKSGVESWGLDKFDNIGKSKNNIVNSDILKYLPKEKFDLVSMFHVLEHVPNVDAVLGHIRNGVLSKGGVLIVQVPNYDSWERKVFGSRWFGFDAPRHLWHFDKNNLIKILKKNGFKIVKIVEKNAWLHPVTIISSMFPELDVQRFWVKKNNRLTKIKYGLWVIGTILTIPLSGLQSIFSKGSMLTVIVKNE